MDAYESLLARRSRRPVRFVVVLVEYVGADVAGRRHARDGQPP